MRRAVPALLIALLVAISGCGGGKSSSSSGDTGGATQAQTSTQPATSAGGCKPVQAPPPRQPPKQKKPTSALGPGKKWSLTVKTNCGDFTIALDLKTAPKASASMVALARNGYFDDTVFHRIAPGFVIQGGDPSASGSGGPGYTTVDKPPSNAKYTEGVVAMAKTQQEPAGAGGSQFFVVTGADVGLPPDYAVLGKISSGLDVVKKIGMLGDQSEQPTEPVVISAVEVGQG